MHYARTPFDYSFGFLPDEVNKLSSNSLTFDVNRRSLERWFKGYSSFDGDNRLFNPWSIVHYVANDAKLDYYWTDGIDESSLAEQILMADDVQQYVQRLVSGRSTDLSYRVESCLPFELNRHGLHNLLYYTGYLNFHNFSFQTPNWEINNILEATSLKWVRRKLDATVEDFAYMTSLLAEFKFDEFQDDMQRRISAAPDKVIGMEEFYRLIMKHLERSCEHLYIRETMMKSGLSDRSIKRIYIC